MDSNAIIPYTPNVVLVLLVLLSISIFLREWEPPIKKQYIFILLSIVGLVLGYFFLGKINGLINGFILTSLVFYKDKYVEEARDIKDLMKYKQQKNQEEITENK